jgi:SAM-dependent methyltransferase
MTYEFANVYDDKARADAYAKLDFPGTYYLAYRDLPLIIKKHVTGTRALDFGCGTGRSTRFLNKLGYRTLGVDISENMLDQARERDDQAAYRLVPDGDLDCLAPETFDLILSVFTFDNIPTRERKVDLFASMRGLLNPGGRIVSLVSSPEIYKHEWASFSTKDFPENKTAECGELVKIVMLDVEDSRPVEDIIWPDEDYHDVYRRAGLTHLQTYRPLAKDTEPFEWVSETEIAPWAIYVLGAGN